MSIIKDKIIAAKSGDVLEAKSLMAIMNGTLAVNLSEYTRVANIDNDNKDFEWAISLGVVCENILPFLYSDAKNKRK